MCHLSRPCRNQLVGLPAGVLGLTEAEHLCAALVWRWVLEGTAALPVGISGHPAGHKLLVFGPSASVTWDCLT